MNRLIDVILVLAVIFGAVWTFQIKHDAELTARELAQINRQISDQRNKIALLKADWEILTGPARLERVAGIFAGRLDLVPLEPSQIISLDELPPLRAEPDFDSEETTASVEPQAQDSIKALLNRLEQR